MKKLWIAVMVVLLVLAIDQTLKIYVKTTMTLGEDRPLIGNASWARLHFIENSGMAFGIQFGGQWGKLILTLFRLVAATFIGYYIYLLCRRGAVTGFIISVSLILAGAIGNIIDSLFYGVIFSDSGHHTPARMFPPEGGYGRLMYGRVVDMFYFPMIEGEYPTWLPFLGGGTFSFFQSIFNVADSAITIGVLLIIFIYRRHLKV